MIARELHIEAGKCFIDSPLPVVLARVIWIPLRGSLSGMRSLAEYIDHLLGTGDEIFDLDAHDRLMLDDDLFTRSKRYFWVINCINEADKNTMPNITVWPWYRDRFLVPFHQTLIEEQGQEGSSVSIRELDDAIERCDDVQRKLETIQRRLQGQRTRALALRDGVSLPTPGWTIF